MVNLERLRARGLRAYEFGRLRAALRIVAVLVPASAVCCLATSARPACGCIAVVLVATAVWLRWRSRQGAEDVTAGLRAGCVPLVVGLVVGRIAPACPFPAMAPLCSIVGATAGVFGGLWLGIRERRSRAVARSWAIASVISALAASLGCLELGLSGIAGATIGIAVGSALGGAIAGFQEYPR
jgi:hypothetical protein